MAEEPRPSSGGERYSASDKLALALACLAGVVAIVLFLVEKTRFTVQLLLASMVALSIKSDWTRRLQAFCGRWGSRKGTLLLRRSYLAGDLTGAGNFRRINLDVGLDKVDLLRGLPVPAGQEGCTANEAFSGICNGADNSAKSLKSGNLAEFIKPFELTLSA
jgi:hypothetical protein